MKKILLLLLFTVASYGQAVFDEGIQITGNANSATATKVNVQETDGTINYILKSSLIDVAESNSAINLPVVGVVGKIYITKDNNKIYRWNGTFYQELAANDSDVVKLTGDQTKNGNLGVNSLTLADNPIGSVVNGIKQAVGDNDWWKIYGKTDISDRSEMVFAVSDNGEPFSGLGQRFRFHYDAIADGVAKDPLIVDYNEVSANAKINITSGGITTGFANMSLTSSLQVNTANPAVSIAVGYLASNDVFLSSYNSFASVEKPLFINPFGGNVVLGGNLSAPSYTGGATLTGTPTAPTAAAGTNTTQIATTAFVQANARPYKVFTALVTQILTNAPTAIVLENTLGGSISFSRVSAGIYRISLTGAFTDKKTGFSYTRGITSNALNVTNGIRRVDNNTIEFNSVVNGSFFDGQAVNDTIEIRVYN